MSKRSDIEKGTLVYTEVLGWVDLAHAKGNDARALMAAINSGEGRIEDHFVVIYSQYMGKGFKYGTSKTTRWKIRKGLSSHDKKRVALTIIMYTSHLFESYQGSPLFSWYSDSGYSGEDLVSNLLGFYRAVDNIDYLLQLRVASQADTFTRWDYYGPIGKYKNKEFRPLLFPHPEKYPNNARPYYSVLPEFMKSVSPINNIEKSDMLTHLNDKTGYNIGVESRVTIQIE
ncbi:hypothetical protein H4F51_07420 [Pectobacterium brasiliense]|uniref:hypothetical protein n=1 Tax=Pectobacterium brasiliense TaxID=180957 RepID=UPI0015DEED40|nr:hypothetical protein [Pectobacterium brasiliense]MBA0195887.1 hypothetical protein [Pectobacterium brasiliense]MBN3094255.1 hypothetical protein [Pectobacterium brasiliense]MBN3139762.1 hypothetical protein [Pectobacterium brasiliense]MBW5897760.1 hypothetical protein [Pectobacterium brasiliense]